MYAKVVLDGKIIDAVPVLATCKFSKRSGMVLRCSGNDVPNGIISERTGNIYQVENWKRFPDSVETAGTVTIEWVEEDEYRAIVDALDANGPIIAPDEPDIPPDSTVEFVKESVIKKMSAACNAAITSGIEVALSDGKTHHFSLKLEDQLNLISLNGLLQAGADSVPYHADGEECRYFSAEDFQVIANTATAWKIYQESYFNSLRVYVQSMTTIPDLMAVKYGVQIPDEYMTDVFKMLVQQQEV